MLTNQDAGETNPMDGVANNQCWYTTYRLALLASKKNKRKAVIVFGPQARRRGLIKWEPPSHTVDELENPPGLQYNVPWAHLFFADERKALALSYLGLSLSGGFLLSSRNRKRLLWR